MAAVRARRDSLRALTSEVLPYEVPIAFDITRLYTFLRRLRFSWISPQKFTVINSRLSAADEIWLRLIFDPIKIGKGVVIDGSPKLREFDLSGGGLANPDLRHPFKFRSRRNNGRSRVIYVPNPHSLLRMAQFVHEFRDSILYYTNRSSFSIRHPRRVAKLQVRPASIFDAESSQGGRHFEQSDLDYAHVSSYFSYRRYNNINRFYSSGQFRACERKYPHLMRADVAKCFDSVYTHTVSWVTNGVSSSKHHPGSRHTFGGRFDYLMQYLNYAETSGIVIGPELSRVFAEIILQEVDVRVERELRQKGMRSGSHYEIMRYVDDYFVFLSDPRKAPMVEEVLSSHLSTFKLHLNDQKQRHFSTPLQSHMSVAKMRIREDLRRRNVVGDLDADGVHLHLSAFNVILDYKSMLIDTQLEHAELANSYLYELSRRRDKTVLKFRKQLIELRATGRDRELSLAMKLLVKYLAATVDVGVFVYSGAPSVSHAIKLARLIASSLRELEVAEVSLLLRRHFCDKIEREVLSQLRAARDEDSFGAHTLLLIDCLIFVNPKIDEAVIADLLMRRDVEISSLNAFGVLTLLRRFTDGDRTSPMRAALLSRAKDLINLGATRREHETERAILLLSLPSLPGVGVTDMAKVLGDAVSRREMTILSADESGPAMFSWDASKYYYERLLLKSAQSVY